MSNLTSYLLPDIENTAQGTMRCRLFVDNTVAALTIPKECKVFELGAVNAERNTSIGQVQDENIDVSLFDDYDNYVNGFWYQLIQGNPSASINLLFTIVQSDGSEEYYFWGTVFRQECNYDAVSIIGSSIRRTPKLKLVTFLNNLQYYPVSDFVMYLKNNIDFLADDNHYIRLSVVLSTMVEFAMGYSFGAVTPTFVGPHTLLLATSIGGPLQNFPVWQMLIMGSDTAFWYRDHFNDPSGDIKWSSYLNTDVNNLCGSEWISMYSTCLELFSDLLSHLFLDCQLSYGQNDGTVKGDMTDHVIMRLRSKLNYIPVILSTDIYSYKTVGQSNRVTTNIRITEGITYSSNAVDRTGKGITDFKRISWQYSKNILSGDYKSGEDEAGGTTELPNATYDVDTTIMFPMRSYSPIPAGETDAWDYNSSACIYIGGVRVVYGVWGGSSSWSFGHEGVDGDSAVSIFREMYNESLNLNNAKEIEIGYKGIAVNDGTTNSQRNVQLGMSTTINDGVDESVYICTKFKKML